MIKPKRLKFGDKIAIVSLSWGGLGDSSFIHKLYIAKERLEKEFGLEVMCMPHALKGSKFISENPKLRAQDLMDAFLDESISGIFCAIGGEDTIRILPYVDFNIIKNNPKVFMGYSDSTVNHLMMYKAGLVSFYGPSIMAEFGEYVKIFDYTKDAIKRFLFMDTIGFSIPSSPKWADSSLEWNEKNIETERKMQLERYGYEVLQGIGSVSGHLLGGCIDVFPMVMGTEIWPALEQWNNAILFFETSEEKPSPQIIKYFLRNLAATGILKVINGIIVGKPQDEVYYEDYKTAIIQIVKNEESLRELPIFYNINIGHASPNGILPYGINIELDCDKKTITILENSTIET